MRRHTMIAVALLAAQHAAGQSIFTIGGGGTEEGRPATLAAIAGPVALAIDPEGNVYVGEEGPPRSDESGGRRVRKIATGTGVVTLVAGNGLDGSDGDGGDARNAKVKPQAVAFDRDGNLLIADYYHRIRRVDRRTGIITTIAGSGGVNDGGFGGDGGPATQATLFIPTGVAVDSSGNVFLIHGNSRIRRVDAVTQRISTIAGTGLLGFSGDGGPATQADIEASAIAIDRDDQLYISSRGFKRIRKIDLRTGVITTIAGMGGVGGVAGDGGPATQARLAPPNGLTIDGQGILYIASGGVTDPGHIRRVNTRTGIIDTYLASGFAGPIAVAVDASGNLFVADQPRHRVDRVEAGTRVVTRVAGTGATEYLGDGGPATAAGLNDPSDLTTDEAGNLFIAQPGRIRKISTNGIISTESTVSGGSQPFEVNVSIDRSGNLYVAQPNAHRVVKIATGTARVETVAGFGAAGFSGDGGPATAARLNSPRDTAVDQAGNLYIVDSINYRIRKVTSGSGVITTIAGTGEADSKGDGGPATLASINPNDVEVDEGGAVYIAERTRVRRIDASTGIIQTVAGAGAGGFSGDGGPATAAGLCCGGLDVAVDASGNLYIVDDDSLRVRRVDAATGIIDTIAGSGQYGFAGDNGPAKAAKFAFYQSATTVDNKGNLYLADLVNDRIRMVPPCGAVAEPVLRSPSNGSSVVSRFPSLRWNPAAKAMRYDVVLETRSPPQQIVAADIAATSFAAANLLPQTTYYWRVIAKGDPHCTPYFTATSAVSSFTTGLSCGSPSVP